MRKCENWTECEMNTQDQDRMRNEDPSQNRIRIEDLRQEQNEKQTQAKEMNKYSRL